MMNILTGPYHTLVGDPADRSSPQAHLLTLLSKLLAMHGLTDRRDAILETFRYLTAESLSCSLAGMRPRRSTLTTTGLPLELSLSLSAKGAGGLRYTTEAGDLHAGLQERLATSHAVVGRILDDFQRPELHNLHRRVCAVLFPVGSVYAPQCRFGMWLGMVHRTDSPDVLKVYYNLRVSQENVPSILHTCISVAEPFIDAHRFRETIAYLPTSGRPAFLCLEYSAAGEVKLKLYLRSVEAITHRSIVTLLTKLGLREHHGIYKEVHRLLANEQEEYPVRALTVYVGLDSHCQVPVLNLYLGLNQFIESDAAAHQRVFALLTQLGFETTTYEQTLHTLTNAPLPVQGFRYHTMLGLSLAPCAARLNIYLTPVWDELDRYGVMQ